MPKPVTMYRWDDEGAPQFATGKYSEIIAVLDACLLTGYGNKQPLGWTKLFTETAACCYQNATGGCVVFSSNTGLDDEKGTYVQACQSAINSTTLVRAGWKQSVKVFQNSNVNWIVIGTDTAVYVFFGYVSKYDITTTRYAATFFIGNLSNAMESDQGKFIAVCSFINHDFSMETSTNPQHGYGRNIEHINDTQQSNQNGVKIHDTDNENSSALYYAYAPFLPAKTNSNNLYSQISNSLIAISLIVNDPDTETDRNGESVIASQTRPACRGTLPGLYSTLCGHRGDALWPAFVIYENAKYMILRTTEPRRAPQVILNTEVWND
ncbi:hypothetical protein [Pseudoalteromonas umbrosa]|uniref:hypothetical protein n=1 Tax=Pseudoalteromonas umbrosa TaxID=3048489 RepID=UPI0024C2725F|nr:hypothetical protein [Pseudoalteromonas sp. B95]MDK1288488.1 hypothetical protein [Pseudoalteromonas sp. B95]